jgi:hypothetical protein
MTKAADGRMPMFGGFGTDEVAEPTAFGKVTLALAVAIAIPLGGWLSLRPSQTEAAVTADEGRPSTERVAPDDARPTVADGETPAKTEPAALAATKDMPTEAPTREPIAKAPAPVEPTAAPERARKRAPRPKSPTPPPVDKPKQTSGMGPL